MYGKTLADFETHLVNNVLFEQKILIYDAYLVNSQQLFAHLAKSPKGTSFFEIAVANELITPVYRGSGTHSLKKALAVMRQQYRDDVYLYINDADPSIVRRLFACMSEDCPSYLLPQSRQQPLSVSFASLLRSQLQDEATLNEALNNRNIPDLPWLLERTRSWRTDLIDKAEERTRRKHQPGIHRSEIFNLIAEYHQLSDPSAMPETHPDKTSTMAFLRWVTQCHQINISRAFRTSVHLVDYLWREDFIADNITSPPEPNPVADTEPLTCEVLLPRPELLLGYFGKDPVELIRIRKDLGNSYLDSLETWRKVPTYNNKAMVATLLQEYCQAICERYLQNTKPQKWVVRFESMLGFIAGKLLAPVPSPILKAGITTITRNTAYRLAIGKTELHLHHPAWLDA